ncbi:hypothetical protein EST38_g6803 [Candolleomyces aberdarensis]|uniref:Uncharacterized protein n=1 Tax=Candolleomyces aberdarensis TaxID=2316362 RepID=A0A4V1Q3L9_9AGAR|nr:hypothetical protein EST38_g6803 [Candolleomyces aberdarensis]
MPSVLSIPYSIRREMEHHLRQVEARHLCTPTSNPVILHWDIILRKLVEWLWPCDPQSGALIPPTTRKCYTPSRISIVEVVKNEDGTPSVLNGEYVASCASSRCGYFVCLERYYTLDGIKVRAYPKRAVPLTGERMDSALSRVEPSFSGGEGLHQVMPSRIMHNHGRAPSGLVSTDLSTSLRKRCTVIRDLALGLPERRFWSLFVQCSLCKTVVLREPFSAFHECSSRQQTQTNIQMFSRALPDEHAISESGDTDAIEESEAELDDDLSSADSDTELPTALEAIMNY